MTTEHDHQRGDHAVELLAVAMRQEETAGFIEEQVVEVAVEFLLFETQLPLNRLHRRREVLRPVGIGEREPVRVQLPDAPDAGIDERLLALAVRCLSAPLDEFRRLRRSQRKADWPDAGDFETRQRGRAATAGAERAGAIDRLQRPGQSVRNVVCHARVSEGTGAGLVSRRGSARRNRDVESPSAPPRGRPRERQRAGPRRGGTSPSTAGRSPVRPRRVRWRIR